VKATRLFSGDDGESHFEDFDIPLSDSGAIGHLSEQFGTTSIIFRETTAITIFPGILRRKDNT